MSTILFDPKITPEFQVDWRRPSNHGGGPFGDLLKRQLDGDRKPRAPKPGEEAADPLPGRPTRVVIAHERTLRGEAQRVEETGCCLPRPADQASAEPSATEEEPALLEVGAAADADPTEPEAPAEAPPEAETATAAEQPTLVIESESEIGGSVAPVIVSVQPADETAADGEALIAAVPLPALTEKGIPPEQAGQDAPDAPSDGTETDDQATAEQQAVTTAAGAGLTDGAAALLTDRTTPTERATPASPAIAAVPALPATPARPEHALLQTEQAAAPAVEAAAIAPARPERSSTDVKLRTNAPVRATPATPASPATPATPAQPHATTLPQPGTAGGFASTGEPFDQALLEGDAGQGWVLHLAQGAASKRPDFVAQLRQHLQNLPAHEQVAVHLQRAARDGTNKFSVQLSPAELGNIHVKLEIDEEKRVTAAVTVERPSTLELLQRDTKGLERALHNAGLNMEGGDLSFSLGRGDQEFAQDLRQSAGSAAGGAVQDTDSDGEQPEAPVAQVMDTAAGVVNLQV